MKNNMIIGLLVLAVSCLPNDVHAQQTLTAKQAGIVTIAALATKGDLLSLKKALHAGLDSGLSINEAKEVLVHLYAYAGFPRSLNAITTLQSVVDERKAKGINDVPGKAASKVLSKQSKFQVGKAVQTKLTGSTATGAPQQFVPIIDTFLKEHLFADIFSRDVLDWKTREMVTISALSSLGGAENQLRSHLNVGLNTGLTVAQLHGIAAVLQTRVGSKEGQTASDVLQSILSKQAITTGANAPGPVDSSSKTTFPKGVKITNNNFTGTAWLQMLVNKDTTFNSSIGHVTFEPGARTNWHYHPGGQILLITNGKGRYQEMGHAVRELQEGDVVKCAPNVKHWHGAAPGSSLSHITIGTNPNRAPVVWLQPVSDAEYNNLP